MALIQPSMKKGRDNPLRNSTGHRLYFAAKLWSLEKPSQFEGYSQVVETVGVGLCLRLISEVGSKP